MGGETISVSVSISYVDLLNPDMYQHIVIDFFYPTGLLASAAAFPKFTSCLNRENLQHPQPALRAELLSYILSVFLSVTLNL